MNHKCVCVCVCVCVYVCVIFIPFIFELDSVVNDYYIREYLQYKGCYLFPAKRFYQNVPTVGQPFAKRLSENKNINADILGLVRHYRCLRKKSCQSPEETSRV